jgi:hypothetical protein
MNEAVMSPLAPGLEAKGADMAVEFFNAPCRLGWGRQLVLEMGEAFYRCACERGMYSIGDGFREMAMTIAKTRN